MTSRSLASLVLAAAAFVACDRPVVSDDAFRPKVAPVLAAPAEHRAAPLDRVTLLRPGLFPPEVRGPSQIDAYVQDEALVDILWVVDNSGSMDNERQRIAASFDRFIRALIQEQVSFHIGVTTTDMNRTGPGFSGQLVGPPTVITNATPDPVAAFASHVDLPDSRVRDEQGLAAAMAAITEPLVSGVNAGFLRPGADLAVVVVTDEDDQSLGEPEHFARRLRSIKGPGNENTVSFVAIIGDVPGGCVSPGDEDIWGGVADPGTRYERVATLVHDPHQPAAVISVCAADFSRDLERLGLAFSGLRRIFPLSAEPIENTLRVEVNGVAVPRNPVTGWIWDAPTRSIQFLGSYVPPPGAEVRVHYELRI